MQPSSNDNGTGKLYRVRDRNTAKAKGTVWGENLTHDAAVKLKERVVAMRKSKTARVEEMDAPMVDDPGPRTAVVFRAGGDDWGFYDQDEAKVRPLNEVAVGPVASRDLAHDAARAAGYTSIIDGVVPAFVVSPPTPSVVMAEESDPQLAALRAQALATSRQTAAAAADRHKSVAMSDPPKPPPSPLTDEVVDDLPDAGVDDNLDSADISDLLGGVGSASEDDKVRATLDATAQWQLDMKNARAAYDAAVAADQSGTAWPRWDELGDYEWAAWRYYVTMGKGQIPPALTKTPRKVEHAGVAGGAVATESK